MLLGLALGVVDEQQSENGNVDVRLEINVRLKIPRVFQY